MTEDDIWGVLKNIAEAAGQIGMTRDDVEKVHELAERYGNDRDQLFEEMLSMLDRSDTSGLRDAWRSCSERGTSLLERLDHEVPTSPLGLSYREGLDSIGGGSFRDGERKIWEANARSDVPLVADMINQIYNADLEVIKQCEEHLKTFQEGDAVIEALVQQNTYGVKNVAADILTVVGKKWGQKLLTVWMREEAREFAEKAYEEIAKDLEENLRAAKEKGLLKRQLLGDIKQISDARPQLSEEQIEEMLKKGEEAANSLPGAGRGEDYRAQDWENFGKECARKLAERCERSQEQSNKIFSELLPTFVERVDKSFAAVSDDPSKLISLREEVKETFKSINEILDEESAVIDE